LYPQWVCWKYEFEEGKPKPTKRPYNPRTGQLASPTNPNDWADYQTAVAAAMNGGHYNGIGFVLSDNDPYTFIDYDDAEGNSVIIERQQKIAESMDSYSEISPSGKGLHQIIKAKIFGGRKRGRIEIYSSAHYFTMTGITYHDKPIAERQQLAEMLWRELDSNGGGNNIDLKVVSQPEKYPDEVIYNLASQAENGQKFVDLWNGNWQKYYNDPDKNKLSCNEADFALINILGFYSRNLQQIKRMFLASALGRRDKAKRVKYVDDMIQKSFDNMGPLIDVDAAVLRVAQELFEKRKQANGAIEVNMNINPWQGELFAGQPDPEYDWTRPPGLLGDISAFIYEQAYYPIKEIAIAGAIGLMSGICGKSYNVSGTGLNSYTLMIAKTGIGKEAAKKGIEKLVRAVRATGQALAIGDFIGPSDISSGPALVKRLNKSSCFVSIVGEFGHWLSGMHSQGASPHLLSLKRKLLELYTTSGQKDVLRETIYSDKTKDTEIVLAPAFSLLGDATPETYYREIDEGMIAEGLISRFMHIEYFGDRGEANDNSALVEPSQELVQRLSALTAGCIMLSSKNLVVDVKFTEESDKLHKEYRTLYNRHIIASDKPVLRELWSRAHLKILKLAALISINGPQETPVITVEALKWAKQLVERDVINVISKFETGKAGKDTGELNQINEVVNCIAHYVRKDFSNFKSYRIDERMHRDGIIPIAYLQRKLLGTKAFKEDRIGATRAIERAVRSLIDEGSVREMNAVNLQNRYQTTAKAIYIVDTTRF
jgi:hypothetical protein